MRIRAVTTAQRRRGGASAPSSHPLGASVSGVATAGADLVVPSAWAPNLPANMTLYADTTFGGPWQNEQARNGFITFFDTRFVNDTTSPHDTQVMEWFYDGGINLNGAGGGGISYIDESNTNFWREAYYCMMIKFSPTYRFHVAGEKFFYPIVAPIEGGANLEGYSIVRAPGNDFTRARWQYYQEFGTEPYVTRGEWLMLEAHVKLSDVGQTNGFWRQWQNGTLVMDIGNLSNGVGSGPQRYFQSLRFTGTRGGGFDDALTPPEGMYRRFSRFTVYARVQP